MKVHKVIDGQVQEPIEFASYEEAYKFVKKELNGTKPMEEEA